MPEPSRDAWRRRQGAGGERVHRDAALTTPFTEHAFLEPECAVAFPYKNGVKVQSTDQGAYDTRKECAHMFGWDSEPERVVVETMLVGGGFGGKEDVSIQHLAALAAYKFQRP